MTVTWVLESNVFAETCFDEMVEHLRANQIPYHVVRVIPFLHEIDGKVPEVEGPCVVYGSIGVQKLAQRHGWTPGVFTDREKFSETAAIAALGDLMLNADAEVMMLSEVVDRLPDLPYDQIFIKPNTDSKEFAGEVMEASEFVAWHKRMLDIGYLQENDFPVMVSAPKTVGVEWRTVVVDGEIVEMSIYKQFRRKRAERQMNEEVAAIVRQAQALYEPAPAYVIDVAAVPDGYRVIEYNTFNSAGLYACRVGPIIDAINTMLENA